jgi:hypothetical protein
VKTIGILSPSALKPKYPIGSHRNASTEVPSQPENIATNADMVNGTAAIHPTREPNRRERTQTTGAVSSGRTTLVRSKGNMGYPLRGLSLRTSIVALSLNAMPAAIEKKTMFQPVSIDGLEYLANAAKLMFVALTMKSTEKSKGMAFLLETRPWMPIPSGAADRMM